MVLEWYPQLSAAWNTMDTRWKWTENPECKPAWRDGSARLPRRLRAHCRPYHRSRYPGTDGDQPGAVYVSERAVLVGDTAWVSLDENLLGDQGGVTVATINIFVRGPGPHGWRMLCHHGSVVQAGLSR